MRIGDYFFILILSFGFFGILYFVLFFSFSFFIYLTIVSFTKSAQFPFIGWLPRAIRAPTPVRSLVHRRTLVTAGLVIFFSFSFIVTSLFYFSVIIWLILLRLFFSGLLSLFEIDLKKLVALRTLSQISLCILRVSSGGGVERFLHMLGHALIKRCLFLHVGYLIYSFIGQQNIIKYRMAIYYKVISVTLLMLISGLCGILFLRSSITKELLLSSQLIGGESFYLLLFFLSSLGMTFIYSGRLWVSFFNLIGFFLFRSVFSLSYYLVSFFFILTLFII